jgi:hypothetical protein
VNNPKNDNLRSFYLVDDEPAHANCFPVDLGFSWDLPALPESQGIFFNKINGLEDFISDTDGG